MLPCVFGDLCKVLPPNTFKACGTFDQKLRAASKSDVMVVQWCHTHNKMCPLHGPTADSDVDVSGLPCPDYSNAGLGKQHEGPTGKVFLECRAPT